MVLSRLKNVSGPGDLSQIIVACEIIHGKAQKNSLRLSRLQQAGLYKGNKRSFRLSKLSLRSLRIGLNDLLSGPVSHIGHTGGNTDGAVLFFRSVRRDLKLRIGQSEAEGIVHLLRRPGDRLKIAVAHIDIFRIVHIFLGFMEAGRGGIIVKGACKGIRQLAGGIGRAAEDVRHSESAFDPGLPGQKHRLDGRLILKPGGIHHASHIKHRSHLRESRLHRFHHGLFLRGKIEISVPGDSLPVPALAGIAADHDHRRIREPAGRLKKLFRNGRLHGLSDLGARGILPSHLFLIKGGKRVEDLYPSLFLLLLHSLVNAAGVGGGHIPASAASPHIIDLSLSEDGRSCSGREGKHALFIFQKHHAFLRRFQGKSDVLRACRDPPSVLPQRDTRLMCDPVPFFHVCFSAASDGIPPSFLSVKRIPPPRS